MLYFSARFTCAQRPEVPFRALSACKTIQLLIFFRQISPTYRRADHEQTICTAFLMICFSVRSLFSNVSCISGGDEGIRTPDLRLAKAALSQLSYIPISLEVGLSGLEPETSPLSEARSNQLS